MRAAVGSQRWFSMGMVKGAAACTLVAAVVGLAVWDLRAEHAREGAPASLHSAVVEDRPAHAAAREGRAAHPSRCRHGAPRAQDGRSKSCCADGTSYPVKIERQETHGGGHWSLVGRVQTIAGSQSMVLTFGSNAVFGQLPMPDGHAMQIETESNGLVTVAPARNLVPPRGTQGRPATPDYRVPPGGEFDTEYFKAAADRPIRLDDRGQVGIDVLALYSPELVALRGSRARRKRRSRICSRSRTRPTWTAARACACTWSARAKSRSPATSPSRSARRADVRHVRRHRLRSDARRHPRRSRRLHPPDARGEGRHLRRIVVERREPAGRRGPGSEARLRRRERRPLRCLRARARTRPRDGRRTRPRRADRRKTAP